MKGRDIILAIMEDKGVTNAQMASRLNLSRQASWDRLHTKKTKDIPASTLTEMLRAMDYKLIVVPQETRTPVDGYEVD